MTSMNGPYFASPTISNTGVARPAFSLCTWSTHLAICAMVVLRPVSRKVIGVFSSTAAANAVVSRWNVSTSWLCTRRRHAASPHAAAPIFNGPNAMYALDIPTTVMVRSYMLCASPVAVRPLAMGGYGGRILSKLASTTTFTSSSSHTSAMPFTSA